MKEENLNSEEKIVYELIKGCTGRITQRQIMTHARYIGCHPIHEDDIGLVNKQESTLRKIRQVIRDLRIIHFAPILSDAKGYFIPETEEEVKEYLERMEKTVKAQQAAWRETYIVMKSVFEIESDFFNNNFGGQMDIDFGNDNN